MKKKSPNKYDVLVENLINEFSSIKDFNVMYEDENGRSLFNEITFRISDIISYKNLVLCNFLPSISKSITEDIKLIHKSKYKGFILKQGIDLYDTFYDTIRLAYVGLFHKFENYIKEIEKMPSKIMGDIVDVGNKSLGKWIKERFDFSLRDWHAFKITHRINWIRNCVKHNDGYPNLSNAPLEFKFSSEKIRIVRSKEDFKNDAELLIDFYPRFIGLINAFSQHRYVMECESILKNANIDKNNLPENIQNPSELAYKFEETIFKMIVLLKEAY